MYEHVVTPLVQVENSNKNPTMMAASIEMTSFFQLQIHGQSYILKYHFVHAASYLRKNPPQKQGFDLYWHSLTFSIARSQF